MKSLTISEQKAEAQREAMEHLSKEGGTIISSRQTPKGKWVHEVEFPPSSLIISQVPNQGRPKGK